jgi:hypothetical protein
LQQKKSLKNEWKIKKFKFESGSFWPLSVEVIMETIRDRGSPLTFFYYYQKLSTQSIQRRKSHQNLMQIKKFITLQIYTVVFICIVYIITLSLILSGIKKMLYCYMYIESIFVLYVTLCLFGGPYWNNKIIIIIIIIQNFRIWSPFRLCFQIMFYGPSIHRKVEHYAKNTKRYYFEHRPLFGN